MFLVSSILVGCSTTGSRSVGPKITKVANTDDSANSLKVESQPRVMKLKSGVESVAIEIDPKAQQQFNTAMDFMAGSRFDDAERVLLQLTQSHPELSGPYSNLAIVYLNQGFLDKAEAMLQQAIRANPASAPAHNQYGVLLRNLGRFEDAKASYENALVADPRFANAHLNLGVLNDLYLRNPQAAIEHYQQFQDLSNTEDKMVKIWIADLTRRYGNERSAAREQ